MAARISEDLQRAIDRAFRDPIVMQGAETYLLSRRHDLEMKAADAARAALFDQSKAPAALMSLGAKQEIDMMLEILTRWKE